MKNFLILFFVIWTALAASQSKPKDTTSVLKTETDDFSIQKKSKSSSEIVNDIEKANTNAPFTKPVINPTKAGLYSAVLPGLGQYYNKKYWKIPVVWGAIGAGVGFAVWLDKDYRRYRDAFVANLNGLPNEFSDRPWIDKVALGNWQDTRKRQRDYAIAITGLIYVLNIVDALVDAHLYEGKNDPDLSFEPSLLHNPYSAQAAIPGFSLNYNF